MSDGERQPHVRLPQLRLHYGMHGDLKRDGDDTDDASGSDNQRHTLSAAAASPGTVTQERKRSRYISDIDRSIIIQRLEKGEKQADLAREFGVTRAAICHINKHKEDVLTRFDEFARSPHGRVMIENYARPSTEFASVTEVRTAPAVVLTTRIMDKTTRPREFRAAADRLIKLLLEEALMSCGSTTVPTDLITSQGAEGLTMDSMPCAVALERDGNVMLNLFKQMEPEAATGSIRGSDSLRESPANSGWQVLTVDLPDGIASASVMLLVPVFSSASLACAAIEELHARGVPPSSVCIVCVFCSFDAALSLSARQPDVSIITAVLSKQTNEPSEPLDDFSHRYFAPTTEGSDAL